MSNRTYRAVDVNEVDLARLTAALPERVVIGLDIGKTRMVAAVMAARDEILATLKWDHPEGSHGVLRWLSEVAAVRRCEVAMEPSGSYGDSLRHALRRVGVVVHRVKPKQVFDARELYDGVPSSHDAKSAATIGWLHFLGRSAPWEELDAQERALAAAVQWLVVPRAAFQRAQNRLEALLARYWPELTRWLELDSVSLLSLLERFGCPAGVRRHRQEARELLRRIATQKIEEILTSAEETLGVPMLPEEETLLRRLAEDALQQRRAWNEARSWVKRLAEASPSLQAEGKTVGMVTAAVLHVDLGPLSSYSCARALVKATGLNLKERSSGKRVGQLAITKRGPSRARQFLYLAALRWLRDDPLARAWYDAKVARDGGRIRQRAIVALMRKLLAGLWWVSQGHPFDSTKLFDVRRLEPTNV